MIPFDAFAEIPPGENSQHAYGDHFLNNFQLEGREFAVADAVRGDLKANIQANAIATTTIAAKSGEWRYFR